VEEAPLVLSPSLQSTCISEQLCSDAVRFKDPVEEKEPSLDNFPLEVLSTKEAELPANDSKEGRRDNRRKTTP